MHYLAKDLVVRDVPAKGGNGVFATRPFARFELLAVFGGSVISTQQAMELPEDERHFALQLEDDLFLLTPKAAVCTADFINHSCVPNAGMRGSVSLVALRAIKAGEEVCYDYAMTDSGRHTGFACECGTSACRGHVRPDDWRRPDLRRRYRGAFSTYLQRRIAAEAVTERLARIPEQHPPLLAQNGTTALKSRKTERREPREHAELRQSSR